MLCGEVNTTFKRSRLSTLALDCHVASSFHGWASVEAGDPGGMVSKQDQRLETQGLQGYFLSFPLTTQATRPPEGTKVGKPKKPIEETGGEGTQTPFSSHFRRLFSFTPPPQFFFYHYHLFTPKPTAQAQPPNLILNLTFLVRKERSWHGAFRYKLCEDKGGGLLHRISGFRSSPDAGILVLPGKMAHNRFGLQKSSRVTFFHSFFQFNECDA